MSVIHLKADDAKTAEESICSSGYGSNGTPVTACSVNDDTNSSRSCSASNEETPDHGHCLSNEEADPSPTTITDAAAAAVTVVRRPKNTVDKIIALQSHRSSCPTAMSSNEHLNMNSSLNSSSSNVSIERLTATDDEVKTSVKLEFL